MSAQRCVTGRDPDAPATIPTFDSAYYNGDSIFEIADALIQQHDELRWITEGGYRVVYFWKGKGGTSKGKPVLGRAGMASGIAGHLTQGTFHVVMSADHCRELTNLELEAAIYHQLLHLEERETEDSEGEVTQSPAIRPHDFEGFRSELDRYGFWNQDIRGAAHSFATQLRLEFDADARNSGKTNPYDDTVIEADWSESDEARRRQRLAEQEADEAAAVERELTGASL